MPQRYLGCANKLPGTSGFNHQIDVSLHSNECIYLIECKLWRNKIGVDEVLVLAGRASDIAQEHQSLKIKSILASHSGFTDGAIKLAKHFDIDLEIIKSKKEFALRIGSKVTACITDTLGISVEFTSAHHTYN